MAFRIICDVKIDIRWMMTIINMISFKKLKIEFVHVMFGLFYESQLWRMASIGDFTYCFQLGDSLTLFRVNSN